MTCLQATCGAVGSVRCAPREGSLRQGALGRSDFRLQVFCKQWRRKGLDSRLAVDSFSFRSNGLNSRWRGGVSVAVFGGGDSPEKKKFITKEEEPEEYWTSQAEKSGENPFGSPLAWIGIIGIFLPFIILGFAFSAGLVKLP